jgi:subtilisin family serine protease
LILSFGLLCCGWVALRAAASAPPVPPTPPELSFEELVAEVDAPAPGQLVFGVAPDFNQDDLRAMLAGSGATLEDWLPGLGLALVTTPLGQEPAVAETLEADPAVDFVAPNRKLARVADVPLDPFWPQQWGMAKVSGPAAWDLGWADPSIAIAIVDTGILQDHWDLVDHTWRNPGESAADPITGARTCDAPIAHNGLDDDSDGYIDDCRGWDFVSDDADPNDEHGHGTVVAGIASAATDNPDPAAPGSYEGVAGMGRQASLMALRVLDSGGRGYAFDIAAAIDYATARGAQVINLSLTFPPSTPDSPDIDMVRRAVAAAQAAGVLVVGASGNENYNGVDYPAKFPGVLAVGASTRQDTRTYFSNYGDRLDLVAPGEGIISTLFAPGLHTYGYYRNSGSGTSFAAPHVAGAAALVRGLRPDLPQEAVYELIRRAADDVGGPGFDPFTGWGRLNADRALSEAAIGLRLDLAADHPTVAAGGQLPVHVGITAPPDTPAGFGARVGLTAELGSVAPLTVTLDSQGRASTVFTASPTMGAAHITASLGSITAVLPITVTSGIPARLYVTVTPQIVPVGGQSVVTATVVDEGGSAAPDGLTVAFTTTLGTVTPITATTQGGNAGTILSAGVVSGTALLQASAGGLTATVPVAIVGAGGPFTLTLTADPAQLRVDGGPASLMATVVDGAGSRVADGTVVAFTADRGLLSASEATTVGGVASVSLTPGSVAGDVHVTARAGTAQDVLVLPVLAGPANAVVVTADPQEVVAGYNNVSRLRAAVEDRYGNPVADGTPITFTAALGRIVTGTVSTAGGIAATDFIGELVAGTSAITATVEGGVQGFVQVRILPGPPAQMSLSARPARVGPGGQVALVATVHDRFGNPVADETIVGFRSSGGVLMAAEVPASDGIAQNRLLAPAAPGKLAIEALCGTASAQASVDVVWSSFLPLIWQ